jgi:hypothetical protein
MQLKIFVFLLILNCTAESGIKKHKQKKSRKMNTTLIHMHRKKHKHKKNKRHLFGLPGAGPSYTDQPKWNLKALNLTTEIPIVVLDKKKQNPLFVVPQIICKDFF